MKAFPLVSIITINYEQAQVTNQLLRSLQNLTWPYVEIIVVDNHSGEEDFNQLNSDYENVRIVKSSRNHGFAGGNNIGIELSSGEYVLLLHNDTEVEPNFIEPLIALFQEHNDGDKIGAVSPLIKYHNQPNTIQYAGYTHMNTFTQRMVAIGNKQQDEGKFTTAETNFAHGCAMMIPRKVIQKVGLIPCIYFLYYEELEWSQRIKETGFKIFVEPKSVVYHKELISEQKNCPMKTYYLTRNRILFLKRNFSLVSRCIAMVYLICISFPKNVISFVMRDEEHHLKAYLRAWGWHFVSKEYCFVA